MTSRVLRPSVHGSLHYSRRVPDDVCQVRTTLSPSVISPSRRSIVVVIGTPSPCLYRKCSGSTKLKYEFSFTILRFIVGYVIYSGRLSFKDIKWVFDIYRKWIENHIPFCFFQLMCIPVNFVCEVKDLFDYFRYVKFFWFMGVQLLFSLIRISER